MIRREYVAAVSLQEVKSASDSLAQREKELQSGAQELEKKLLLFQEEDQLLVQRKLEVATAQRELLNTRAERILRARADMRGISSISTSRKALTSLEMLGHSFDTTGQLSPPPRSRNISHRNLRDNVNCLNGYPEDLYVREGDGVKLMKTTSTGVRRSEDWRTRFEEQLNQAGGAFVMSVYESGPGSGEYELQCAKQLLYQQQAYF